MKLKEEDVTLPIFTNDKILREHRKQKYIEIGNSVYQNAPDITEKEYKEICDRFKHGDKTVLTRLIELTIKPMNNVLADIFARYDIEEVIPYDETLSYCLERLNKYLLNYTELPDQFTYYASSMLNFYAIKFVNRMYSHAYVGQQLVETMPQSSVTWKKDQIESCELDTIELNREDVRRLLIRVGHRLSSKQKEAIGLKFGFKTGEEVSFGDIARIYNVSRSRVADLVNSGLDRLRRNGTTLRKLLDNNLEV